MSSSACANYRLSANDSTALELVAHRGSVDGITTLLHNGVHIHAVKSNEQTTLDEGHDPKDAASVGRQL